MVAAAAMVAAAVGALAPGHDRKARQWAAFAARWGRPAVDGLIVMAVVWSVLLIVDGRYRCFPLAHFAGPAFGLAFLAVLAVLARPGRLSPGAARLPGGQTWVQAVAIGRLFGTSAPARSSLAADDDQCPGGAAARYRRRFERAAAGLLIFGSLMTLLIEGVANQQAVIWAALQVMLAVPYLAAARVGAEADKPLVDYTSP